MKKIHVLYNARAHNGKGISDAEILKKVYPEENLCFADTTKADFSFAAFLDEIPEEEMIILTGGDGTLNTFINAEGVLPLSRKVWFYPSGTGNDFVRDIGKTRLKEAFLLNPYVEDLPVAEVNGRTFRFINGIGFGLDGYCCEENERLKALHKKSSYTFNAVKGLLKAFRPCSGHVTIDGVTKSYEKIWMAPTMYGSYFGGGVNMAPSQDRDDPDHTMTCIVVYGVSRIKALCLFIPAVLGKGEGLSKHIEYKRGHHVEVEFDEPRTVQSDGETFLNVRKYVCDL